MDIINKDILEVLFIVALIEIKLEFREKIIRVYDNSL